MRECDQLGLEAFLARGGDADGATQFEDDAAGRSYPAKATGAAAPGHLPGGRALPMKEFFGGQGGARGHAVLEKLGYRILRGSADASDETLSRERIESVMDAFEEFRVSGAHADVFAGSGAPKDFWVRLTRPREDRCFRPSRSSASFSASPRVPSLAGGASRMMLRHGCTRRATSSSIRTTCRFPFQSNTPA
jgi:5-methylcytosine-specific restriction protein B